MDWNYYLCQLKPDISEGFYPFIENYSTARWLDTESWSDIFKLIVCFASISSVLTKSNLVNFS